MNNPEERKSKIRLLKTSFSQLMRTIRKSKRKGADRTIN